MIYCNAIKTLYISIFTTLILTSCSQYAFSQIFNSDQNPPGVKWRQINTVNFQLIYPIAVEAEAQRMANTLEEAILSLSRSLNKKPRRISIILQNQGVISNAFVQLAPRRSEFFTTPPQSSDPQDWLNGLVLHEMRHLVQLDKMSRGLKAPFFEELALAIFGITLPPWFYEGDAVGVETALSHAGRGRLPEWEQIFRTNTLSTSSYSYSKNYFGSVKDRTPGYYQLGYFMTSKLRRDYGKDILDSIMTRISRNPFRPYSLSNSIRKYAGLSSRELHDSTVAELKGLWKNQAEKTGSVSYPPIIKRKDSIPADYLFPVRTPTGDLIVLKQGLAETPVLIKVDKDGREHKLLRIGYQTESNFKYSSGKLVWDEFRYDKRFLKRSFNVINIYDADKKYYRQLTHKSRLFSPSLSPDGKRIAAVSIGEDNSYSLVELDSETGKQLRSFPNPLNYLLQTPSYNQSGEKLISVAVNQNGAALLETDLRQGKSLIILPFARQQLSRPVYAGEKIVFRAHYNGVNNIYSLNPGTSTIRTLTSSKFGAANPYYDSRSNTLIFNNYQIKGHDVSSVSMDSIADIPVSKLDDTFINYAGPLIGQESGTTLLDTVPSVKYPVKPYREINNLFYFHSLSPSAANDITDDPELGLILKSNNQLNTLDVYAGYQFNNELKKSEYLAGFVYKGFYPMIDVKYMNRPRFLSSRNGNTIVPVNWREHFTELEVTIPVLLNGLNKIYNLGLQGSTSYTSRYEVQNQPGNFISQLRFPMKYQMYLNRNVRRSARDLAPRWGQNFSVSYHHFPFERQLKGSLLSFRSIFYTPGIFLNHSFQASFNYQENDGAYDFNIDIPRISGYSNIKQISGLRNTLLLDYRFPLFYPDAEIGPLAYIKRIKSGFFADFENIGKGNAFEPRTFGLELRADMNLLRFYIPNFDLGGKLIFENGKKLKNPNIEFGFTYNY